MGKKKDGFAVWGDSVYSQDQERRPFLQDQTGVIEGKR
jgi:hypothetical protein